MNVSFEAGARDSKTNAETKTKNKTIKDNVTRSECESCPLDIFSLIVRSLAQFILLTLILHNYEKQTNKPKISFDCAAILVKQTQEKERI